jgi:hypothetical protein
MTIECGFTAEKTVSFEAKMDSRLRGNDDAEGGR